jgi:Alpha/beta hydrolase family
MLEFTPTSPDTKPALIFLCGGGVSAHAYASLLRPLAETGHPVFIVKLPYRLAPLESHKQAAVHRARGVIAAHPQIAHWVVSGHSLGAALACRVAQSDAQSLSALVLIGTTHPRQDNLSSIPLPVTKIYASNDGVAPPDRVLSNKRLLPNETHWIEIKGGNHSQFGHYGHQLFDGNATITRETQQAATRAALLEVLAKTARWYLGMFWTPFVKAQPHDWSLQARPLFCGNCGSQICPKVQDSTLDMKIPSWSAIVIIPAIILVASVQPIANSENPIALSLIMVAVSLVVAIVSWGLLGMFDSFKSKWCIDILDNRKRQNSPATTGLAAVERLIETS